jgi:GTP-binding protein
MKTTRTDLRNIAIIAHVDHGKTTLVDGMLRQAHVFHENQQIQERVMDSGDLERERGITILSKNTAIKIINPETGKNVKINIVDTPGHADFGGEVERVLNMVDAVLLLIDAAEGPKPQTRFVLKKALALGLKAIVVINKIDRKDADPDRVLNETFDLFIELGATDEQADFPVIYAIAKEQRAGETVDVSKDLQPLFKTILTEVSPPIVDVEAPLQMLVTNLDYDNYRGVTAVGRIFAGKMKQGETVMRMSVGGKNHKEVVKFLYVYDGLIRAEITDAVAGDIVAISGLESVAIGETLADVEKPLALPAITIEDPTVRMTFGVNTGPFSGMEGRWSTSRKIRERLFSELKNNVALRVEETESPDNFIVSGRGELHLAILIETMRREGYEFQVSRPEVILRRGKDGKMEEPYEEVHIETSHETAGVVIGMMGKRQGNMQSMVESDTGTVQLIFIVPSRGILGFRYKFLTATRGLGVMNSILQGYGKMAGKVESRSKGSLVAWEQGKATPFGLKNAEERGYLFIKPGIEVYTGMIVGEHQRPGDLDVNICKTKHLSNMRSASKDIEVRLSVPREMSLDEYIEYLTDDELLEVTPENLRIRKRELDRNVRNRATKREKKIVK